MKSKMIFKTLLFLFIVMGTNNAMSNYICPPDTGTNCREWLYGIYTTSTENPDCLLTVSYHYRACNGVYQIYIDSLIKTGNCNYLVENGDNSAFFDWLNLVMIEEIDSLSGEPTVANCPDSSLKVIFYAATCGIWVKCTYLIDESKRFCDPDWRGDYPDYSNGENRYIDFWKWQNCGNVCCKKTYSICKQLNGTGPGYELRIKSMKKERAGDCSNPEGFHQPCQDGC